MIGCGDVTEKKSGPAFNKVKNSKLVSVMCRTPGRAEDYARRHGIPRWSNRAEELLSDKEIDAVYIATPPDSHLYYTELAANYRKAVYVEKPMARTYEECKHMIKACDHAGVPLFVAYYRRYLPKFLKVKELIDSNIVGEIRTVSIHLLLPPRSEDVNSGELPWRVIPEIAGGGYFMDLASHQFDLLDYLLGPIADAAGTFAHQTGWYPAEDIVSAHFRFENGILGNGLWCFSISEYNQMDRTIIFGNRGTISFSFFDTRPVELKTAAGLKKIKVSSPEHVQQPLIKAVVNTLLGKDQCVSTGVSAARTNAVLGLILKQ
ncbi:MAG: Gfo/Idh/MocA family oxidoreductase [bacterium]|nr:MAG: Gfo/Idh/MocA family oxidoreductase [bacterium]